MWARWVFMLDEVHLEANAGEKKGGLLDVSEKKSTVIRENACEEKLLIKYVESCNEGAEVDLRELLPFLKSKVRWIALASFVCALLMIAWGLTFMPVAYRATEKLYVMGGNNSILDLTDLQIGSSLSSDYREVFHNKELHEQVRQKLALEYTDDDLDSMINVENPTGRIIMVTVSSPQSDYEALRMVEEYCEVARLFIEERMGGRIPSVFEKAVNLEFRRGLGIKTIVAFLAGAVVSVLIFGMIYVLDDRVKERQVVEKNAGIPVLCVITQDSRSKKILKRSKRDDEK